MKDILSKESIAKNIFSLFIVQVSRYILPLATVPYLIRVLGAEEWGKIVLAQSLAQWLTLTVEYGFGFSATTEISKHRHDNERISDISSGVLGALSFLILLSVAFIPLSQHFFSIFNNNLDYPVWAWFIAVSVGINPLWYFQGVERIKVIATTDLAGRILVSSTSVLLIHNPNDGWKVLAIQGVVAFLGNLLLILEMSKHLNLKFPAFKLVRETLVSGWDLFLFRLSTTLYTVANTSILGLAPVSPREIAFFGEAQRLSKAIAGLSSPVCQTLFPRVSFLIVNDYESSKRVMRRSTIFISILMTSVAIVVYLFSENLMGVLLGGNFEEAIALLKIMAIIIPIVSINYILSVQWMIPLGLDKILNKISMSIGLAYIPMAVVVSRQFGVLGLATFSVCADICILLLILFFLTKKHSMFFGQ
jgi:polysaccharide transporter, PST family